jgi:hypothetical protein
MMKSSSPFKRDFLLVPWFLPGHFAFALVCRPLALVEQLIGLPHRLITNLDISSDPEALVDPCIIYVDSLGSRGQTQREILAQLLVQAFKSTFAENLVNGTQLQETWEEIPGPKVCTLPQTNSYSCGDRTILGTRNIIRTVVAPALRTMHDGQGALITVSSMESIMDSSWYTEEEVARVRPEIMGHLVLLQREYKERMQEDESGGRDSSVEDDLDLEVQAFNEVAMNREKARTLREQLQDLLAGFTDWMNTTPEQVIYIYINIYIY